MDISKLTNISEAVTSISCTKLFEFIGHPGCMYVLMMTSLVWAGCCDSVSSGALTLCCISSRISFH